MNTIRRIVSILLFVGMINSPAYSFTAAIEPPDENEIKSVIEKKYGINVVISDEDEGIDMKECLVVLERSLRRFPEGVIKEITQSYDQKNIETNVVINKTEKIAELFTDYILTDDSATIHINAFPSRLYKGTSIASEESTVHELGHFISGYIFELYGYDKLKEEFSKFNEGFEYGSWNENYENIFLNKHSAKSFEDEISDLIWYTELHPDYLRNLNSVENEVIHEKVEHLAHVFDKCFDSVDEESRLWMDAVPQEPDNWAVSTITAMKNASLIPEKFDGIYEAYITKEDFYTIAMHIVENRYGSDNLSTSFNLNTQEEHVTIDPVNGEIFLDDGISYEFEDNLLCSSREGIFKAYQMGIISHESAGLEPESYMTRLDAAKLMSYIADEFGTDISDYSEIFYDDLSNVSKSDKPFIYFVASRGLMKGYGTRFNPYGYCTYQETYIMLLRLYNIL